MHRVNGGWRWTLSRAALAVVVVAVAVASGWLQPAWSLVARAQVKDLTGVYNVEEADSNEPFVVEITQRGNLVEGYFRRGAIEGTMLGTNSIPKFVGQWEGADGSRGSFDMDILPNQSRLEGLWRFEAPAPSLRKHIWTQRLGVAPRPPGQPLRMVTGSAPPPAPVEQLYKPGPILLLGVNLGQAMGHAAVDGDPAEIRAALAQVKIAAPTTGLPLDTTPIDIALATLDSGAPPSAIVPALQTALRQWQALADGVTQ